MDVAVVIPSYKVCASIVEVLEQIGPEVTKIYVVDDACPDGSGRLVENHCSDRRVTVLYHSDNQGVGGAVITGYRAALADNMDIIVKVDGDGQMDPSLIPCFIAPIIAGEADYTKGNRFFNLENLHTMPKARLLGNALLSLITKISSGYWDLFDPTNGYTAIHRAVAQCLPFEKISPGYFFETDMLFRLNTVRAVVVDVPMAAKYGLETSHLKIHKIIVEFAFKNLKNFVKRIFYNYYLRDMSLASIELPLGILLLLSGITFGSMRWIKALHSGAPTPAGAVMLAALPVLLGLQFILAFIGYDIATVPKKPLHIMKKWRR